MENFTVSCKANEVKDKIQDLMTIQERLAIDSGLVFSGVNEDGNMFIGNEATWEYYESLQERYTYPSGFINEREQETNYKD